MKEPMWEKSTFCEGGSCAEVAIDGDQARIRNNQDPDVQVTFSRDAWNAFLNSVHEGGFRFDKV